MAYVRDAAALAKRCPGCGRLLPHDSLRCGYCLTEVRDVLANVDSLPTTEAVPTSASRRGLSRTWGRVRALPRWALLLAGIVLVAGGWFAYQSLKPERILASPSSTARDLVVSSEVWGAPGADSGNTRQTTARLGPQSMHTTWQTDLGVAVVGEPVADAARLYVATSDNRVIALDLRDGAVSWIHEAPVPIGDGVVASGDRVFLTTRRGDVVSLEAASGAVVWEVPLDTNFYNAPALRDGVVYAFGARRELFGLDAEDGSILWTIGTGSDWATEPPLVTSDSVIVSTADTVKVFGRVHGNLTLEHPHGRVVGMALLDGRLISVSANFIAAVDPAARLPWWWGGRGVWFDLWVWGLAPEPPRSGLEWLQDLRPTVRGPQATVPEVFAPALGGGLAVVATDQGVVRAFDLATGDERWSVEVGAATGAPVITPDGLALPLRDALSLRSLADGSELSRLTLPVASRRSLVVTSTGAFLVDRQGRVTAAR